MILSNLESKGYSVLAFPLTGEMDKEDLIFNSLKTIIRDDLKEILESSEECNIPEVVSSDNEFIDIPGFYLVITGEFYSLYNYLQGKWYKLNYDKLLKYNIRRI